MREKKILEKTREKNMRPNNAREKNIRENAGEQ
jgi:hypothetical protein